MPIPSRLLLSIVPSLLVLSASVAQAEDEVVLNQPPDGFRLLFNGQNLDGWKGLVANPARRAAMSEEELAQAQVGADEQMRRHWHAEEGIIMFDGGGKSMCTTQDYADFEMYVDWMIEADADSGIYLRGSPQVQIWDPAHWKIGSGGLYNNRNNPSEPSEIADHPIGEWNTFFIRMIGENVTIRLNGTLIVEDVPLENYWERGKPIYPWGQLELQNHGDELRFRNVFIRELVTMEEAQRIEEALPETAQAEPAEPRRVLALIRATGYRHDSIPHSARAVQRMGQATGAFETLITDDITRLSPESLSDFDAVVLCNTTGNWIQCSTDDAAKLSDEGSELSSAEATTLLKQSLLDFVSGGGGLVGLHSASDANYDWPEFGQMLGGYFHAQPWDEQVGIAVERPDHPLSSAFGGENFDIADEIVEFRDPYDRESLMVLLSLDPERTDLEKGDREDNDFAVSWIREHGEGRVFYCSLGHRKEIYWNEAMLQFYLDGIQYAIGDLEADVELGR